MLIRAIHVQRRIMWKFLQATATGATSRWTVKRKKEEKKKKKKKTIEKLYLRALLG